MSVAQREHSVSQPFYSCESDIWYPSYLTCYHLFLVINKTNLKKKYQKSSFKNIIMTLHMKQINCVFLFDNCDQPLVENHWMRTTGWEPLVENHRLRTTGWEPLNENHWMRTTGWEPLVYEKLQVLRHEHVFTMENWF